MSNEPVEIGRIVHVSGLADGRCYAGIITDVVPEEFGTETPVVLVFTPPNHGRVPESSFLFDARGSAGTYHWPRACPRKRG